MNKRLTTEDLAELLAEYTKKDKKSMDLFLREFVAVVTEGVLTDNLVKVKDLGSFKIVRVEKRESIHVNTGESFLIPEHYKFTFLPDKELREIVNKPFSFFETTEVNENVDFSDLDSAKEENEKDLEEDSDGEEEKVSTVDEALGKKSISPVDGLPILEDESVKLDKDIPIIHPQPQSFGHKMLIVVSAIAILLGVAAYVYYNLDYFTAYNDLKIKKVPLNTAPPLEKQNSEDLVLVDSPNVNSDTSKVNESMAKVESETQVDTILAKIKIEPGSRLTLISLEYYGSKLFWVYLYEHNKAIISDPNNIPIGTEIEIPIPGKYGIDAKDRASLEKAATLQSEILLGK